MESKKNKKYDYERKRHLFFGIGMVLSLGMTITAFEWKTYDDIKVDIFTLPVYEPDEILDIKITRIDPPEAPKPIEIIVVEDQADEKVIETPVIDVTPTDEPIIIEEPVFDEPIDVAEEAPVNFAETMPSFDGGIESFYSILSKKIRYPALAKRMGTEGKVFVSFVVEKDGSLSDIEVMKGIGSGCDEEALRVMKTIPAFIPGKQGDRLVRVRMVVPIHFQLR